MHTTLAVPTLYLLPMPSKFIPLPYSSKTTAYINSIASMTNSRHLKPSAMTSYRPHVAHALATVAAANGIVANG